MQHPAQFDGPHVCGVMHEPKSQTSPSPAQSWQASPATPHAVEDAPFWHVLPTQHPGQFDGPHVGCVTHAPLEQVAPVPKQSKHCSPPKPHAVCCVPAWHELPTQHPGQFCGPHVVDPTHAPFKHDSPKAKQSWHVPPPAPHAKEFRPDMQTLPTQQPLQFCGPHDVCPWQKPLLHASPLRVQSWHW
jgi:hypothetical protein